MSVLFFIPLTFIAFFESTVGKEQNAWVNNWLRGDDEGAADYPEVRDPDVNDDDAGRKISKVPYDELVKMFPDTTQVCVCILLKFSPLTMIYSRAKLVS